MALKSNKLSKAQILRDTKLLKNFLFNLVHEPYMNLRIIIRPFERISYENDGGVICYFNRLGKLGLVDIIFESIIEIDKKSPFGDSFVRVDKLCEMVEDKLRNALKKVNFSKPETANHEDEELCAEMIPSLFRKDLYDTFIRIAKRDDFIEYIQQIAHDEGFDEILKETNYNKPITIDFRICDFEGYTLEWDEYNNVQSPEIYFSYIAFLTRDKDVYGDQTTRHIRIEDLSINPL